MAKYEINHTCGHTETVQLFGKCSERERKIEWMERQECPECRRKHEAEKAAKITEGMELPELTGSDKQVAWANSIRAKFIEGIKMSEGIKKEAAIKLICKVTDAKTFIDCRFYSLNELLTDLFREQVALAETVKKIAEEEETTEEEPATEEKKPVWKKIAFNVQNVQHATESGVLIALPHSSDFDGFKFWVSKKLVREGRNSFEHFLSVKDDMVFKLIKTGKGRYNKKEVIDIKEITADELAEAFSGYVSDAPVYTCEVDFDKEEVIHHVPEALESVEVEADAELVR